jgi:hypothetical protein
MCPILAEVRWDVKHVGQRMSRESRADGNVRGTFGNIVTNRSQVEELD